MSDWICGICGAPVVPEDRWPDAVRGIYDRTELDAALAGEAAALERVAELEAELREETGATQDIVRSTVDIAIGMERDKWEARLRLLRDHLHDLCNLPGGCPSTTVGRVEYAALCNAYRGAIAIMEGKES